MLSQVIQLPITVVNGKLATVSGINAVQQRIITLLTTPIGTRLYNVEYGCDIDTLLFEPADEVIAYLIKDRVISAIEKFEPSVTLDDVSMFIYGNVFVAIITYMYQGIVDQIGVPFQSQAQ